MVQGRAEQGYAFGISVPFVLCAVWHREYVGTVHLSWVCRSKERGKYRGSVASGDGFATVSLRGIGLLTVDAQCPPWVI